MAYPYALHQWGASKFYELGEVVRANPAKGNTLAFKCIVEGTSDAADVYASFPNKEPSFPFKITQTLVDGSVTWEAFEPLAEELLKLAPTAIIDLFEIELTLAVNNVEDTLRFHDGKNGLTEDIKFGGYTYPAAPIEVDGFEFNTKGTLPRPTLRVANVNNYITNTLQETNSAGERKNLLAAKVRRIRTFAKFIDTTNFGQAFSFSEESDVTDTLVTQGADTFVMETFNDTADQDAKVVETWYVDRISAENQELVEIELSPKLDLVNVGIPRRTIEEFCPWEYRGPECNYQDGQCFTVDDVRITGGTQEEKEAADVCGKRLKSCQKRFGTKNNLPFGGFYGSRLQA